MEEVQQAHPGVPVVGVVAFARGWVPSGQVHALFTFWDL